MGRIRFQASQKQEKRPTPKSEGLVRVGREQRRHRNVQHPRGRQ